MSLWQSAVEDQLQSEKRFQGLPSTVVWTFSLEPMSTEMKACGRRDGSSHGHREAKEKRGQISEHPLQDIAHLPPLGCTLWRLHHLSVVLTYWGSSLQYMGQMTVGRHAAEYLWRAPGELKAFSRAQYLHHHGPHIFLFESWDSLAIKSVVFEGRQSHVGSPGRKPGVQNRNETRT